MKSNLPNNLNRFSKCQYYWLMFVLLIVGMAPLKAQIDKEFWFAIPKETQGHGWLDGTNFASFKIINIDKSFPATVKIEMPLNDVAYPTQTIVIPPGESYVHILATTYPQFDAIYANPTAGNVKPISGSTKRGIHIISDVNITVYYDYDNFYNRELFALKGANSLGTDFFTPFQTIWYNDSINYSPAPTSSIEIVATENGTVVTIEPTVIFQGFISLANITINLNRGETYSLVAKIYNGRYHPSGTRIRSNKKIAVSINDDSVWLQNSGGCRDIIGDQLVPTNIIGKDYVVMCGDASFISLGGGVKNPLRGEQIFVVATEDNTTVTFRDTSGTIIYSTLLNRGETDYISPDINLHAQNAIHVKGSDSIYVLHITGIGCEIGGALLPPITDCTGSSEVTFYRSSTVTELTLNLMIQIDTADSNNPTIKIPFDAANQSYKFFTIYTKSLPPFKIPNDWFEPIKSAGWAALKKEHRGLSTLIIPENEPVTIKNSNSDNSFFHLGMTNGQGGRTNKYGYFSSYSKFKPGANTGALYRNQDKKCFGEPIYLRAGGGNDYTWWHIDPNTGARTHNYLSDYKSANPIAYCPTGINTFEVLIHMAKCFPDTTMQLPIVVRPEIKSAITTNKTTTCAPDSVIVTNNSTTGDKIQYQWYIQEDSQTDKQISPASNIQFTLPESLGVFNNNTNVPINYTIKLKTSYALECVATATKDITIYPEISANFTPINTVSCNPALIPFTNLSAGNVTNKSYTWLFGDGASSVAFEPDHTFENIFKQDDDTFDVQLVAASPYYCRDTATGTVIVHPYIKAGFTVDTVKGCSPLTIRITNNSQNPGAIKNSTGKKAYEWDFGHGLRDTTSKQSFTHTFPANTGAGPMQYKVLLTVRNNSAFPLPVGCPDTISRQIVVFPQASVSLFMNPDKNELCDSTAVQFTAANPSDAVTSYLWDFGDGNTSTQQNPQHLYRNLSLRDTTYTVTLTGFSDTYCNAIETKDIVVHPFLDAQFGMDVPSHCAPFEATITNKSRGGNIAYNLDYGDGSLHNFTDFTTIKHTYTNSSQGTLTPNVKLLITNGNRVCRDSVIQPLSVFPQIKANFLPSVKLGCNPLTVKFTNLSTKNVATNFLWNFDDNGTSSTIFEPTHIFNNTSALQKSYNVKLTTTSANNCVDDTTIEIRVEPYLEAKFSVDSAIGCSPFTIKITNSSRGAETTTWTPSGVNNNDPKLTFTNLGLTPKDETLKIRVSNGNDQCFKEMSITLKIYPEVVANFTAVDTIGCNPLGVKFTYTPTNGRAEPTELDWDFGDNGTFSEKYKKPYKPTWHTYENLRSDKWSYTATLKATSQFKCSTSKTQTITVYPYIDSDFVLDSSASCSPYTVNFINASPSGVKGGYIYYDDTNLPENFTGNPKLFKQHIFRNLTNSVKTYSPKLVVYYLDGAKVVCKDSITRQVTIYPEVTANFTPDKLAICSPGSITFTNSSLLGSKLANSKDVDYNWWFGDNGTSNSPKPTVAHSFINYSNIDDSVKTVTLDVTSKFLCKSTKNIPITIHPKPRAQFAVDRTIDCPPFNVLVHNQSIAKENTTSYTYSYGDTTNSVDGPFLTLDSPPAFAYDNFRADIAAYNLQLLVETEFKCTDIASQTISVYPHVLPEFTPDTAGCNPLTVLFKNNTQRAKTYLWNFGDNVTGKIKSPMHKYFNPKTYDTTYTATMIGYSEYGCADTATREITVYPQPAAEFSALPSHLYFPDNIITIKNETNAGSWKYFWDYADGQSDTIIEPKRHEFLQWGGYDVKLIASSDKCRDSITHFIRVFPPIPISDLETSENGCVPLTATFTDRSTWATSWLWEFDDGSTSTEQNPTHIYVNPGKYEVKLTVEGDGGEATTYRTVDVYPKPTIGFSSNPMLVMLGNSEVKFRNTTKNGVRYLWNFGDTATSTELEPIHKYTELGNYNVKLQAWSVYNCYADSTATNTIMVEGQGKIEFPNAFNPNEGGSNGGVYNTTNDTENQVFHPFSEGVIEYTLEIYDRWGEKLFETTDPLIGWDGYYKGKICKSDVYIWKAKGKYTNGLTFDKAGDVTLLR